MRTGEKSAIERMLQNGYLHDFWECADLAAWWARSLHHEQAIGQLLDECHDCISNDSAIKGLTSSASIAEQPSGILPSSHWRTHELSSEQISQYIKETEFARRDREG